MDTGFVSIAASEHAEEEQELKALFLEAANVARSGNLSGAQSDEAQLQLYGLYKQATMGPAGSVEVSFWDVVGKAKHEAWSRHGSMSKTEAMQKYVQLVQTFSGENGGEAGNAAPQQNKGWKSTSKMAEAEGSDAEEDKVLLGKRKKKKKKTAIFLTKRIGLLVPLS